MGTAAQNMGCGASSDPDTWDDSHSSYDGAKAGCGTRTDSAGRRTMKNYSKITASAGEHTQHCLWIMVLKADKYQPKYSNMPYHQCTSGCTVTPCTGGCLYPTYGVGTVFEPTVHYGEILTITEAIYPSKIVMRSKLSKIVQTCTFVATPGGAEIRMTWVHTNDVSQMIEYQLLWIKEFVEAEAEAILAESPLPSEAAVRQLQPAAGTMITVPQGSSGGQQLTVQTASGPVTCVVPEGMVPGNQFMVRPQEPAPGPAPAPMQQAPIQQQSAPIQDQVVAMQQQPDMPAQTLAKFCTSCGTRAVAEFCSGCGARVV